jgi:SanA protein
MRKWLLSGLLLLGLAVLFPFLWREALIRYYEPRVQSVATVREAPVAIVFGARVYGSGRLSGMLRDRVETAIALYESGKVSQLLMSGGVESDGTSEPVQMRNYAISRGVPPEAILIDEAGLRTYDSCYRAANQFAVSEAILVTQRFHLPRAQFTCSALGIESQGVDAARRTYHPVSLRWSEWREVPATFFALVDVVRRSAPA